MGRKGGADDAGCRSHGQLLRQNQMSPRLDTYFWGDVQRQHPGLLLDNMMYRVLFWVDNGTCAGRM